MISFREGSKLPAAIRSWELVTFAGERDNSIYLAPLKPSKAYPIQEERGNFLPRFSLSYYLPRRPEQGKPAFCSLCVIFFLFALFPSFSIVFRFLLLFYLHPATRDIISIFNPFAPVFHGGLIHVKQGGRLADPGALGAISKNCYLFFFRAGNSA